MMRLVFTLLTLLFSTHPSLAVAATDIWDQKAPFENAVITYDVSGSVSGTEMLYVRRWGKEIVRRVETTTKVLFISSETNTITITTPQWVTTIDREKKSGRKMVNPAVYMKEEYEKLTLAEKKQVLINTNEMGKSFAGQYVPNEREIEGYLCDKTTVMGTSSWNIHNSSIMMKTESSVMGIITNITVSSLTKDAPPANLFSPPAGVTIVPATAEEEQESKDAAVVTMNWLKDPESPKQVESVKQQPNEEEEEVEEERHDSKRSRKGSMKDSIKKGMGSIKDLW